MNLSGRHASTHSPELALLLAASRGDPDGDSIRRLMAGPLDWGRLTRLAVEGHATPVLWGVVSAFPNLPDEARALQRIAVVNDFRRFHIAGLVARLARVLHAQDIEFIVLKGAALLVGAVSAPVARTMSDIDILIVRGSPEDAWRACREDGWEPANASWTEELYARHHHLSPLVDPEGIGVGLEVHRALLPGADAAGISIQGLRERVRTVSLRGVDVLVPSIPDLLLHDCLHFAWANKLQRGATRAFTDLHAIVGDPAFDWREFLAVATSPRARKCCYWTLRLARQLSDLPVPDWVPKALDATDGGPIAWFLERHFVQQILEPGIESEVSERARRRLWLAAMGEFGASTASANLWSLGAVDLPGESSATPRVSRGALRAALSTVAYTARLLVRG